MSTAVMDMAEIEFVIEERQSTCSDVIECDFDAGTCGWTLGTNTSLHDTSTHGRNTVGSHPYYTAVHKCVCVHELAVVCVCVCACDLYVHD